MRVDQVRGGLSSFHAPVLFGACACVRMCVCVCVNPAPYNLGLFRDLRLEKNFLSQFVQALLEFMSLGLKAGLKLK